MSVLLSEFYEKAGVRRTPSFSRFVNIALNEGSKPFQSQVEAVSLCLNYKHFGLFDETGSGKTVPIQAVALYYIAQGNRVLVLMPPILLYQFKESLFTTFEGLDKYVNAHVIEENPKQRAQLFAKWDVTEWPQFLCMTYEMFLKLHDGLYEKGYTVVIADEAQRIKNVQSKAWQRLQEYVGTREQGRTAFFPMTGTPTHRCLEDAYALVKLLNPKAYGSTDDFERTHCIYKKIKLKTPIEVKKRNGKIVKLTRLKKLVGYRRHEELNQHLYRYGRRVLKRDIPELANLKDPRIQHVTVRLGPEHLTLYRKLSKERFLELADGKLITALQEQELRQRVLQMITCPELFLSAGETIKNAMLDACRELITPVTEDSKVILFMHFRESIELYSEALKDFNPARLYGGVSADQREFERNKFLQDSSCRLLIGNAKSCGAGLNFQGVSHTVIFGEPTTVPGDFKQAMDRVVRPGQLHECDVWILKALSTIAPDAVREMLRRDTENSLVHRDPVSLKSFYLGAA